MNSLVSAEKASIIGFLGLFSEIVGFFDDLPYVVEIKPRRVIDDRQHRGHPAGRDELDPFRQLQSAHGIRADPLILVQHGGSPAGVLRFGSIQRPTIRYATVGGIKLAEPRVT